MAVLVLPTSNIDQSYTFQVTLEGVIYNFRFWWNTREEAWYFDLYDVANVVIMAGQKVTSDWDWFANVTSTRKPPGQIYALDTTDEGEPGLTDLGQRIQLLYVESE